VLPATGQKWHSFGRIPNFLKQKLNIYVISYIKYVKKRGETIPVTYRGDP
jgi:hypothetical protein